MVPPSPFAAVASPACRSAGHSHGDRSSAVALPPAPAGPGFRSPHARSSRRGLKLPGADVLSGGATCRSVPLQLKYDPAKLTLVNVTGGDLLSKDGQAVALIHRDDGPGNVTVVASRPPGTTGVSGSGTVCVLSFQAKVPGQTSVT